MYAPPAYAGASSSDLSLLKSSLLVCLASWQSVGSMHAHPPPASSSGLLLPCKSEQVDPKAGRSGLPGPAASYGYHI